MIRGVDMSDGTGRQAMAAQSGTSDNPKSSNQESSKKPKTLGKYLLVSATAAFGWNAVLVKFLTMACQFAWGYPLCKEVIFR